MLHQLDESILFLLAVALFLGVLEAGYRFGRRRRAAADEAGKKHIASIQTALFALLSLLLGFNLAMASSRFDARRSLVQDEVNAIATTYLRAGLLPRPQQAEVVALLRTYLDSRLAFMDAGSDQDRMDAADARSSQLEMQLWAQTTGPASTPAANALLVQSLNEMINLKWKRRTMMDNHVPQPVIALLLGVAIGALSIVSYGYGLAGPRRHASTAVYAVLVALVLAVILDLDRPRGGLIRVPEDGLLRLKAAFDRDAK